MKAKKSLGQNFLNDTEVLSCIRDEIDPLKNEIIIEVGPGMGALTRTLLPFVGKLVAIEKDPRMIAHLQNEFAKEIAEGKLELLERDILTFDFSTLSFYEESWKIVGNIPYYITGALFRKLFEAVVLPEEIVFLVQKEVAERIVAKNNKHSLLSLSIHAYGNPSIVRYVDRSLFEPIPKVDSAVLKIANISNTHFTNSAIQKRFFELIHAGFAHPRKMLQKNLTGVASLPQLAHAGIKPTSRAEDVSLVEWLSLAKSSNSD